MYIIHGTWIPEETDEFVQQGGFVLWVETDAATGKQCQGDLTHPRQLSGEALAAFLTGTAGVIVSAPAT
ncbi:MAG: hypothetical protein M3176_14890, partial [Chloroflexota bacterium]|nr:hypothetical protein [Chloroflexota bacterium]